MMSGTSVFIITIAMISTANSNNGWFATALLSPRPFRQKPIATTMATAATTNTAATRTSSALFATTVAEDLPLSPFLNLYNSQTRTKEQFPRNNIDDNDVDNNNDDDDDGDTAPDANQLLKRTIRLYTCGPTVYDSAHVGNFRAFLTYDIVKRVLLYLGFADVLHVCNLTDVDDKIIQRANERKLTNVKELTTVCERNFFRDLESLNIVPARHYPRATEHIDDMMDMIRQLQTNGLAYETSDGSWYFRTQAQPGYGQQFVKMDFDAAEEEAEEAPDNDNNNNNDDVASEKEHWADFCLWKAFKPGVDRDDAAWESPPTIQKGRPGWHLECSAMVRHFFGDQPLDLHGGGVDLQFPHHENEIAQSEGAYANRFCDCWMHNGFVNIDNEKMSKSLGNFLTLRQACPKPADVRAYRYLVVSSQYRQALSFSDQALGAARKAIQRMDRVRDRVQAALNTAAESSNDDENDKGNISNISDSPLAASVAQALHQFRIAIRDDLSMPRASAALFSVIKAVEAEFKQNGNNDDNDDDIRSLDMTGLQAAWDAIEDMDRVFGIFYEVPLTEEEQKEEEASQVVPEKVLELVEERTQAKEGKDWALADSLRDQITELGYAVKDVKGGPPEILKVE